MYIALFDIANQACGSWYHACKSKKTLKLEGKISFDFWMCKQGIWNILFGSEIVTFHLFVIVGLPAYLRIALIGFVAYAA